LCTGGREQARRPRAAEEENQRLQRLVAVQIQITKESKKWLRALEHG